MTNPLTARWNLKALTPWAWMNLIENISPRWRGNIAADQLALTRLPRHWAMTLERLKTWWSHIYCAADSYRARDKAAVLPPPAPRTLARS